MITMPVILALLWQDDPRPAILPRVTLIRVAAAEAMAMLARSVGAGFVISDFSGKKVTVDLEEVPLEVALRAVCDQANASYEWKDGAFYFAPRGPEIGRIEFVDEPFSEAVTRLFQRSNSEYAVTGQIRGLVNGRFFDTSREAVLQELCRQVGAKFFRKGSFYRVMPKSRFSK